MSTTDEQRLRERLAERILVADGGTADPWKHHWNLTEADSLLHRDALAALSAAPSTEQKNAARYEWLKAEATDSDWEFLGHVPAQELDAAIDAQISKAEG